MLAAHIALAVMAATAFATPVDHEALAARATPADISILPGLSCGLTDKQYVVIVLGTTIPNGAPVQLWAGSSFDTTWWTPPPAGGQGQIKLSWDPRKCIDAGSNPGNGVHLKVWDCYDVPQQQWKIHNNKIELVGYNLCFDVLDGNLTKRVVQTWACADGNPNQDFYPIKFGSSL